MKDSGMSLLEWRQMIGLEHPADFIEYIRAVIKNQEVCYACCEEKCIVEKDGFCDHGQPSVLLKRSTPIIKGE